MPEPDLVLRAQQAGAALESAWQRWRVVHGLASDPMPAVSSYVGYTIEEPWGQPRVVFGLPAQDAEQLASLLERYDDARVVYTAGAVPARDLQNGDGARSAMLSVPQQAPSAAAEHRNNGPGAGLGEPLYHMAAAAVKEATGRLNADGDDQPDDEADTAESAGSLTRAASAARAAAEARIRATMTEPAQAPGADRSRSAASAKGPAALPKIQATDTLEPLPGTEAAASDDSRLDGEKPEPKKDDKPGTVADDKPKQASEGTTTTRRSRMPKAPIPRMSKAKRPGVASAAPERPGQGPRQGSGPGQGPGPRPGQSERSGQPETSAKAERPAS